MKGVSKDDFVALIQEHQGLINSLCCLYGAKSDQGDLRQEIILQLWRAFPNFRRASKASTWIYRIALNTILGWKRGQARQPQLRSVSEQELCRPAPDAGFDDDLQQLQYAIGQLSDINKAIVILHLEGYAHGEIAEVIGLTSTNVSTRFGADQKALKKNL